MAFLYPFCVSLALGIGRKYFSWSLPQLHRASGKETILALFFLVHQIKEEHYLKYYHKKNKKRKKTQNNDDGDDNTLSLAYIYFFFLPDWPHKEVWENELKESETNSSLKGFLAVVGFCFIWNQLGEYWYPLTTDFTEIFMTVNTIALARFPTGANSSVLPILHKFSILLVPKLPGYVLAIGFNDTVYTYLSCKARTVHTPWGL